MKHLLSILGKNLAPLAVLALALGAGWYFRAPLAAWFGFESAAANGRRADAALSETWLLGDYRVAIALDPETPRVGENRIEIETRDAAGNPLEGLEVSAVAEMPAMGAMPAMRAAAVLKEREPGRHAGTLDLSMAGAWPLTVTLGPGGDPGRRATLRFDFATTRRGLKLASSDPPARQIEGDPPDSGSHGSGTKGSDTKSNTPVKNPDKPINALCPIQGNPVPEDAITVEWQGHVIGFCCGGCDVDWEALPEEKKRAFVAEALKTAPSTTDTAPKAARPAPEPEDIAFHTCSMHPSVKSKDPGTCPICKMDLTPVTHEEVREGIIFVDSRRRKLINLRTAAVEMRALTREVRAVGRVTYDETTLRDITLKTDAWIGEVMADFTGREVAAGEPLFTYYSPEVLSVQQDLIDSARDGSANERLIASARERLRLFDLTDAQIDTIAASGRARPYVEMLAPADGTVIEKMAVAGSSVMAGKTIYRLADLRRVWVQVAVYESDLALIREGQVARLTLSHLPGIELEGKVAFIDPALDPKTRTARARIVVDNPDGQLKPDLFAEARILVPFGEHPAIPAEAVLHAGESDVVFLDLGEDRIRPQKVALGHRAGEWVQVREGLKPGDVIVTSGNFLIASESKLKSGKESW